MQKADFLEGSSAERTCLIRSPMSGIDSDVSGIFSAMASMKTVRETETISVKISYV